MSSSIQRPLAGLALAAALAAGLFAVTPSAQAAPLTPAPALAGQADTGIVQVRHGWHHRHHHWGHRHWGHRHGWHHRHHGWGHRHHGWGHRHHGWGHRHHRW